MRLLLEFISAPYEKLRDKTDIHLDDKLVDRKERMIQFFAVLFGLLLANSRSDQTESASMSLFFILFLLSALGYYTLVSKCSDGSDRNFINRIAWSISWFFSAGIVIFLIYALGLSITFNFSSVSWHFRILSLMFYGLMYMLFVAVFFSLTV